jgi:hypothetical protein
MQGGPKRAHANGARNLKLGRIVSQTEKLHAQTAGVHPSGKR